MGGGLKRGPSVFVVATFHTVLRENSPSPPTHTQASLDAWKILGGGLCPLRWFYRRVAHPKCMIARMSQVFSVASHNDHALRGFIVLCFGSPGANYCSVFFPNCFVSSCRGRANGGSSFSYSWRYELRYIFVFFVAPLPCHVVKHVIVLSITYPGTCWGG